MKKHKWFQSVVTSWNDVRSRKLKPPIIPKLRNASDVSNYAGSMIQDTLRMAGDEQQLNNSESHIQLDFSKSEPVPEKDVEMFSDF